MPEKPDPSNSPETANDRFAARAMVASVIFVSLVVLTVFLWYSLHVILLIFAGILMAILLRGLADWVKDLTGLGHGLSLAIVLLVIAGVFVAVGYFAAPSLSDQTTELSKRLPAAVAQVKEKLAATRVGAMLLSESPKVNQLMSGGSDVLANVTGVVSGTLSAIVTVLVVLFTGLFLAMDPALYIRGVLHLVPPPRRDRMSEVLGSVGYTLKWWLIGQAIDMIAIGTATGIGLWLLHVPLALLLGFLAGLANFIPNFGPLVSLVPACLLALTVDPHKIYYVIILYIVLQSFEGYVLQPSIQSRAVELPGAMTIMAQVLMGILAGPIGLVLATPIAAATLVLVKMLYVQDTLGDCIATPEDGAARNEVREVRKAAGEVRDRRTNGTKPKADGDL
jgi:predicted PurR-regulated permease PerM